MHIQIAAVNSLVSILNHHNDAALIVLIHVHFFFVLHPVFGYVLHITIGSTSEGLLQQNYMSDQNLRITALSQSSCTNLKLHLQCTRILMGSNL